jgi:hypothetical protein
MKLSATLKNWPRGNENGSIKVGLSKTLPGGAEAGHQERNMNRIEIRTNGIKPDNVVAEWEAKTTGGAGDRKVILIGWGRTEIGARQNLFEQAKAMRDELNQAIEGMIEELCAGIGRS